MNWLNPNFLALTIPLGGIVVALYLLRMRRRDLVVPASFLWPERTDEVRANSLFQKLKFNWLMILQLAAILLLAAALAQPQIKQKGLAGGVTAIVIDASASMSAKDGAGGKSRFETALGQVEQIISSASAGDRLALIWGGIVPKVVFPLSSDPSRQRAALAGLKGTEAQTDIGEALRLASALVGSAEKAQILLLSDGVFPSVENFSPGGAKVVYRQVGSSSSNLAIEALGVGGSPPQAFVSVRASGSPTPGGTVSLYADGQLIDSQKLSFAKGNLWSKTVPIPASSSRLEANLETKDFLAADNVLAAPANPSSALRVLLVGKGSLFLERALTLEPRVVLDKAQALPDTERSGSAGPSGYDLVIFDGVKGEKVKAPGVLVFGAESPIAKQSRSLSRPVWQEDTDHPALKDVSFDGVYVETASLLEPIGSAKLISSTSQGGWIAADTRQGRTLHVGFLLSNSDFPLSVTFPIFISNALDWLGGAGRQDEIFVQPGQPFSLPRAGAKGQIKGPQGFVLKWDEKEAGPSFSGLPLVGRHEAEWDGGKAVIYSSLRTPTESVLLPVTNVSLGGKGAAGQVATERLADVWKPLLLLVLCVLAAEWWLFARRS